MLGSVMEMIRSGAGWGTAQNRALQTGIPVLVNLRPFEVLVDVTNSSAVNPIRLQTTVGTWMEDGFREVIDRLGSAGFAPFEQVFLTFQQQTRRSLLREVTEHSSERELQQIYKASYAGVSVWSTSEGTTVPTEDLVASIQLQTILTADTILLDYLQDSSLDNAGLGEAVQAVQAQISTAGGGDGGGGGNSGLDVVVIIAIVVAVLAFVLLGVTLFLAYRRNAKQKDAYKVGAPRQAPNNTAEEKETGSKKSKEQKENPPQNINGSNDYAVSDLGAPSLLEGEEQGGGLYPESLISEDISTSLTAYYRGGLSSRNSSGPVGNPRDLNDAGSISSMESYGYSLDGFQSIAGNQPDSFLNGTEKTPDFDEVENQMDVPARVFDEPSKDSNGVNGISM